MLLCSLYPAAQLTLGRKSNRIATKCNHRGWVSNDVGGSYANSLVQDALLERGSVNKETFSHFGNFSAWVENDPALIEIVRAGCLP